MVRSLSGVTGARVHFVCGSTGAGKTTYAARLADDVGAVRFSIDEWMSALFWMDMPQPLDPAWSLERVERCSALIWRTAAAIAMRGTPVVLELGLVSAARRARYRAFADAACLATRLHFVDATIDERRARVERRNAASGGELAFAVTREMFDFVEAMWEPPSGEEMAEADGVRVAS